jgi:hypothetical protein
MALTPHATTRSTGKNQSLKTFEQITVIVQGPVQALNGRKQEENITRKCLLSVRDWLPGAKVILSTWLNQDLNNLDYDELITSEDPGTNVRNFHSDGSPQNYNNNRQIVSTLAGLKRVITPYALKLRSDNYLTSNHFVDLQCTYPKRSDQQAIFEERVVVSNVFTRKYAKGFRVAHHLSDFFYFGLTKDLLAIWNLELLSDINQTEAQQINQKSGGYPIDCTQMFWIKALQKYDSSVKLSGLLDGNKEQRRKSDLYYANNLVIGAPEDIGLGLEKKFSGKARIARLKGRCAQWQLFEWEDLYHRHCDPSFVSKITPAERWIYALARFFYILPSHIETRLKLAIARSN